MNKMFRTEGVEERIKKVAIAIIIIATLLFFYMVYISKAWSYLSKDPKACINCHVMNTQYATWQHSSHARDVTCVECHLPTDGFFNKYMAKARDGFNHTVAFTFDTYEHAIKISDDGAKRVQNNCISCHKSMTSIIGSNADKYHNFADEMVENGRKCWSCHQDVPHGKVRGLTTTPNNLGIKEVK
ncbi:Cytochrome c nitrite reductase, small subunit NrfH [hydrothermal vent metagenome]|uniref:Cytochrome c nitrite reductase, small subunit NrfH n=1 Tax=hydrothermal vent metagenome TaxID=652676 RepID=A0A1W1CJT6_9ZZZZ